MPLQGTQPSPALPTTISSHSGRTPTLTFPFSSLPSLSLQNYNSCQFHWRSVVVALQAASQQVFQENYIRGMPEIRGDRAAGLAGHDDFEQLGGGGETCQQDVLRVRWQRLR